VTLLYLNPIWLAGSAHGYDTWDYQQVDPAFGTEAVLRQLLDQAHARGMKVIWDFVPNHVGIGFGPFQDAVTKGTASSSWGWFTFKVPAAQVQPGNGSHYDGWWGLGSLPVLNTSRPDVMTHLMDAVRKWTRFGFDGIRVDVPNEIKNRQEFFRLFRQTAKGIDPEFAERVFEQIRGFGEYGFPESHAASFALLVYVSAWLKCHHPAAFTAALLASQPMGFYAPAQLVRDARQHGVRVLAVDVNASDWHAGVCGRDGEAAGGGSGRSGPLPGVAVARGLF
jgi:glycosidase